MSILLNFLLILNNLSFIFLHFTFLFQEKLHVIPCAFHDLFNSLLINICHSRFSNTIAICMKWIETISGRSSSLYKLLFLIGFNVLSPMIYCELVPVIASIIIFVFSVFIFFEILLKILLLLILIRCIESLTTLLWRSTTTTSTTSIRLIRVVSSSSHPPRGRLHVFRWWNFFFLHLFWWSSTSSTFWCIWFCSIPCFFRFWFLPINWSLLWC